MLRTAWLTPHYSLWRERRMMWKMHEGSGSDGRGGEGGTEAAEQVRTPFACLLRPDGGLQVSLFNVRRSQEALISSLPAEHPDTAILSALIQKNAFWAFGEMLGNMGGWGEYGQQMLGGALPKLQDPALQQAFIIALKELRQKMTLSEMVNRFRSNCREILSDIFFRIFNEIEGLASEAEMNANLRLNCRRRFWNLWKFYYLLEESNVAILMEELYKQHSWLEQRNIDSNRNEIHPPGVPCRPGEESLRRIMSRNRIMAMAPKKLDVTIVEEEYPMNNQIRIAA